MPAAIFPVEADGPQPPHNIQTAAKRLRNCPERVRYAYKIDSISRTTQGSLIRYGAELTDFASKNPVGLSLALTCISPISSSLPTVTKLNSSRRVKFPLPSTLPVRVASLLLENC